MARSVATLLAAAEAPGNPFFTAITGGTVHELAPEAIYAGGVNRPLVMVELKLPEIALPDPATRAAFVTAATDVVDELTVDTHARPASILHLWHVTNPHETGKSWHHNCKIDADGATRGRGVGG